MYPEVFQQHLGVKQLEIFCH